MTCVCSLAMHARILGVSRLETRSELTDHTMLPTHQDGLFLTPLEAMGSREARHTTAPWSTGTCATNPCSLAPSPPLRFRTLLCARPTGSQLRPRPMRRRGMCERTRSHHWLAYGSVAIHGCRSACAALGRSAGSSCKSEPTKEMKSSSSVCRRCRSGDT